MAIGDYKITEQQIAEKGVVAAPDMLTGTAQENKGVFDRLVRETVAPAFNKMIDDLGVELTEIENNNEQMNADEEVRKTQENGRVAAEEQRERAEEARQAAEQARADETAGIVAQAMQQVKAAEAEKTGAQSAASQAEAEKTGAAKAAEDALASKKAAAASVTEAGNQASAASGFAVRAEEALSKMGVHIGADTPANGAKLWLCPVNNPLVMNPDRATSDMTQEVGVDDDGKLVTTVEDGSISESKLAQDVKDKFRSLSEEKVSLPKDDSGTVNNGTNGQILQTNGDGTTEWVDKPNGGTALTVTNTASVGQTVKITAVDENGQPAEWEAVDMASGGGSNLPTPTAEDAGKVPVVNADGTGYGLEILASGGETATPELLYSGTAENVSAFQQNIDMKGHRRFCVIVGGTKGESAISIKAGYFYLGGKGYKIFYFTSWLDARKTSYPEGCVTEHFTLVDEDKIVITYQQHTTSLNGILGNFQGNSSMNSAPKLGIIQGYNATNEDGIELSFSAAVESVTVYVFGY